MLALALTAELEGYILSKPVSFLKLMPALV